MIRGFRAAAAAVGLALAVTAAAAWAETARELVAEADRVVQRDPASLTAVERAIALYEKAAALEPAQTSTWVRIARAALHAGDLAGEEGLRWYDVGKPAAERAIALDRRNADAHFLLAAHRGHIAKRRFAAPWIVRQLEEHLRGALEIDPRHSRALHMMGRLLRDTPAPLRLLLRGSKSEAEQYLRRAVEADPDFAAARLDLAEEYESAGRVREARAQAEAVLALKSPKHRAAAEALLKRLPAQP